MIAWSDAPILLYIRTVLLLLVATYCRYMSSHMKIRRWLLFVSYHWMLALVVSRRLFCSLVTRFLSQHITVQTHVTDACFIADQNADVLHFMIFAGRYLHKRGRAVSVAVCQICVLC